MKKLLYLLASCAAILAVSCTKGAGDPPTVSLKVSATKLDFKASGNTSQTITVTAENVKWDISMSAESKAWITASITDDKTLTVTVSDNETDKPRNGAVVVEAVDNQSVEPKRISISQAAGDEEATAYTLSVDPASMTFVGEGAQPQEATVTVSDEKLTWTVAPEDSIKDWVHVRAEGDKITVTVDDNPETEARAGNLIITPGIDKVNPKAIRVTQEGKILPPSLSVNKKDVFFRFRGDFGEIVAVTAVKVDWDVRVSDTPDELGGNVEWINPPKIYKEGGNSSFSVSVKNNYTTEERVGYIIVTSNVPEVPHVTVKVTQEAGLEFITNLPGDVEITDMQTGMNAYVSMYPNQEYFDNPSSAWDIELWAAGVTRAKDWIGYQHYKGMGTRFYLAMRSERMGFNPDGEYYLSEGEYYVTAPPISEEGNPIYNPFTILPGDYTTGNMSIVNGSWYLQVMGGDTEEDVYGNMAPITGGKITVSRDGDIYTYVLDLTDDANNKITGTCIGAFGEWRINFMPDDETVPDPNPENPDNPDTPDNPDKPTPFGR